MRYPEPIEVSFWKKVDKNGPKIISTKCWLWKSYSSDGYGFCRFNKKNKRATHVSWYLANGFFPKEWMLHKCDNRKCVNPKHLYDGNRKENIRDMLVRSGHWNSKKKYCSSGHLYSKENTRIYRNSRYCRLCDKMRKRDLPWKM